MNVSHSSFIYDSFERDLTTLKFSPGVATVSVENGIIMNPKQCFNGLKP